MTPSNRRLVARVAAQNNANKIANRLQAQLLAFFAPYVRQKIEKVDGSLLAKIAEKLPELPTNLPGVRNIYRSSSRYTMPWTVKTWESTGEEHSGASAEASVYVGNFEGAALASLYPPHRLRENFTAEEILAARAEVSRLEKELSDAKSGLCGFGQYDN